MSRRRDTPHTAPTTAESRLTKRDRRAKCDQPSDPVEAPAAQTDLTAGRPDSSSKPVSLWHRFGGLAMAIALFGLAIFAGFRFLNQPAVALHRNDAGQVIERQNVPIRLGKPGDCIESLNQDAKADINQVDFVNCASEHQVVVVGATATTDSGTTEAAQKAAGECVTIARTVTGVDPADSAANYRLTILPPGGGLSDYLCLVDYAPHPAPPLSISR